MSAGGEAHSKEKRVRRTRTPSLSGMRVPRGFDGLAGVSRAAVFLCEFEIGSQRLPEAGVVALANLHDVPVHEDRATLIVQDREPEHAAVHGCYLQESFAD